MNETKEITSKGSRAMETPTEQAHWMRPSVDIFEDSTGITLQADMPGVSKERLTIMVDNGTLTLDGDVDIVMPTGMDALYADVRATHYRREFNLSNEMDADKVDATLKEGVVTLRIPKRHEHQRHSIEIRTE